MSPTMLAAMHATDVLTRVRDRLEAAGAVIERDQFERLSTSELELLVQREVGW